MQFLITQSIDRGSWTVPALAIVPTRIIFGEMSAHLKAPQESSENHQTPSASQLNIQCEVPSSPSRGKSDLFRYLKAILGKVCIQNQSWRIIFLVQTFLSLVLSLLYGDTGRHLALLHSPGFPFGSDIFAKYSCQADLNDIQYVWNIS